MTTMGVRNPLTEKVTRFCAVPAINELWGEYFKGCGITTRENAELECIYPDYYSPGWVPFLKNLGRWAIGRPPEKMVKQHIAAVGKNPKEFVIFMISRKPLPPELSLPQEFEGTDIYYVVRPMEARFL